VIAACGKSNTVTQDGGVPLSMTWLTIPAGNFKMGCDDIKCSPYEQPAHDVSVSEFKLTATEITQAQYQAVVGRNPSHFTGCPNCPVESVTWHEAKAFCESGAVGGRLPSEAEWEYAARAGTETMYTCGDDAATCLDGIAWYADNSNSRTHSVDTKTANAFGLSHMLGNVYEWVDGCWHNSYTGAPSTGGVRGGGDCAIRVLRGGGCGNNTATLRVSYRTTYNPGHTINSIGFRCARD